MKNNLKLTLLLAFGFCITFVNAQKSANTSGGDATGTGGTVSYSIGQVAYTSQSGSNGNINQGVQQPFEIYSVGVEEIDLNINLNAFPNPISELLNLQFDEYGNHNATIQLFDQAGKILHKEQISNTTTTLDLSQYVSGLYLLNILSDKKIIKTFKIIKK